MATAQIHGRLDVLLIGVSIKSHQSILSTLLDEVLRKTPRVVAETRRGQERQPGRGVGWKLALGPLPVKASHAYLANDRAPKGLRFGYAHCPLCEDIPQSVLQVAIGRPRGVPRIVYPSFVAQDAPAVQHKDVGSTDRNKCICHAAVFVLEVGEVEALLLRSLHHLREGISRGQIGIIGVNGDELHPLMRIRLLNRDHPLLLCLDGWATVAGEYENEYSLVGERRERVAPSIDIRQVLKIWRFLPYCYHGNRFSSSTCVDCYCNVCCIAQDGVEGSCGKPVRPLRGSTLGVISPAYAHAPSETAGELFDDPLGKGIRYRHNLGEDIVKGSDILLPFFR